MASLYTDFSEYLTGSSPFDWTVRWGTFSIEEIIAGGTPGKQYRLDGGTIQGVVTTWNDANAFGDDLVVKMSIHAIESTTNAYLAARLSGADNTDESHYSARVDAANDEIDIIKRVSGSFTTLASAATDANIDTSSRHKVEMSVEGTSLDAKAWDFQSSEPGSYEVSSTDSSIATGDWVGIYGGFQESRIEEFWIDEISTGPLTLTGEVADFTLSHPEPALKRPDQTLTGEVATFSLSSPEATVAGSGSVSVTGEVAEATFTVPEGSLRTDGAEAQFYTNFSEYTTSATPFDWTELWEDGGSWDVIADLDSPGNKAVNYVDESTANNESLTWDDAGEVSDFDIWAYLENVSTTDTANGIAIGGRFRGSTPATRTGYYCRYQETTDEMEIFKVVGGSVTELASSVTGENISTDSSNDPKFQLRMRVEGNTLKAKIWQRATPEPDWMVETTDEEIGIGAVGLFMTFTDTARWGQVGIGINGANPPIPDQLFGEVAPFTLTHPEPTLTVSAADQTLTGEVADVTLTHPEPTISGSGTTSLTGEVATFSLSSPEATVGPVTTSLTGEVVDVTLTHPEPTITGSGTTSLTGEVATFSLTAPEPSLSIGEDFITGEVATFSLSSPEATIAGSGTAPVTGEVATLSLVSPEPLLAVGQQFLTGEVLSFTLSSLEGSLAIDVSFIEAEVASMSFVAPEPSLAAAGTAPISGEAVALTLASPEGEVLSGVQDIVHTIELDGDFGVERPLAGTFTTSRNLQGEVD